MTSTPSPDIDSRPVAVIGAGTLGSRIAAAMANQGGAARVFDLDPAALDRARRFVDATLPRWAEQLGSEPGTVSYHDDLAATVQDAWLVVEAVPERLDLKRKVLGELDRMTAPDVLLATNSSSYASADLIDEVEHPDRVLNAHFQQPPELNAVELMSSGSTAPETLESLAARLRTHGLQPFIVRAQSTGFIINRVWAAVKRECLRVVADGVASPEDVNELWRIMFRTPMGPFDLMDRVGLDAQDVLAAT